MMNLENRLFSIEGKMDQHLPQNNPDVETSRQGY